MLKNLRIVLAFVLVFSLTAPLNIKAEPVTEVKTVKTYNDLKQIADSKKEASIKLGNDITVEKPLDFLAPVTIDGAGFTLNANKEKSDTDWESLYILKFHRINATVRNITLKGGDAAIQVNNSTLVLEDNITLGDQAFGGIELTQGDTKNPLPVALTTTNAKLTNATETRNIPTVWTDKVKDVTFNDGRFFKVENAKEGQDFYYLSDPKRVTVSTAEEFKQALAAKEEIISLDQNLVFTEKVNITYPVRIEGNGHMIIGDGNVQGFQSFYLLHFYKTTATVSDLKLSGGDAAILINGSEVTLLGDIDVTGNELGGIELTQGDGVTQVPKLTADKATLINDSEDFKQPTVWVDDSDAEVLFNQQQTFHIRTDVVENQIHYYLNQVTTSEQTVTETVLDVLENLEFEGFEIEVDKDTREITLRKLEEDARITEDDVVYALTHVIMNQENVSSFVLNDLTVSDYDEETVQTAVRELLHLLTSNTRRRTSTLDNLTFALRFNVQYFDLVVPTEDLTVTFAETDAEEPTEKPVDKEDPTETPDTDKDKDKTPSTDDKTDGKTDTDKKTPATGLSDVSTMYVSLVVIGALVLVLVKLKKKNYA